MDILKQFVGLLFIHMFNVIAAAKFSAMATQGDECSWYFIIYLVDILFTTGMSFLIMTRLDRWFDANGYKNLVSGNYFKGFHISLCYWTEQLLIWLVVISAVENS